MHMHSPCIAQQACNFALRCGALRCAALCCAVLCLLRSGVQPVAQGTLGSLLGGTGCLYGSPLMSVPDRTDPTCKAALLRAVSGGTFFARGFLWDEGFHQVSCFCLVCLCLPCLAASFRTSVCSPVLQLEHLFGQHNMLLTSRSWIAGMCTGSNKHVSDISTQCAVVCISDYGM